MVCAEHVDAGYSRRSKVFEDLNLRLCGGNIYGLYGANGAGKSTLLKLITGLIFPSRGNISVMGFCPARRRAADIGRMLYIPDEIGLPKISFRAFVRSYSVFYPRFSAEQLGEYAGMFGIDPAQRMDQLSFGQRKKLYVSFVLACNTDLVVMDEPTNGLDIASKKAFRKIMASVPLEGRIFVVSTHQVHDLDHIVTGAIMLKEGKIILDSSVDTLSERLCFGSVNDLPSPLYVDGLRGFGENTFGCESDVDIELLYNALNENEAVRNRVAALLK